MPITKPGATAVEKISAASGQPISAARPGDRRDHPEVRAVRRGNKRLAMDAAENEETKRAALSELEKNFYSKGSDSQRSSAWATWTDFHAGWFKDECFLPLTAVIIYAVAAMFRKGGYRSFKNYLDIAMGRHIDAGYVVTDELERAGRKAERAVKRGMGPSAQAGTFDVAALALASADRTPNTRKGPQFPRHAMIAGSFFLTREVELSAAKMGDFTVDESAYTVKWHLPASKTDIAAEGVFRTWGCVGGKSMCDTPICPYHAIKEVIDHYKELNVYDPTLPMFGTAEFKTVSKKAMVASFKITVGQALGADSAVICTIKGHTLRVAGSQQLAKRNMNLYLIQLMGRWGSDSIKRYVAEAPLDSITKVYTGELGDVNDLRDALFHAGSSTASASSSTTPKALADGAQTLIFNRMDDLEDQLQIFREMVADDVVNLQKAISYTGLHDGAFVRRSRRRRVHVVRVGLPGPPSKWKTVCGWRFGGSVFTTTQAPTTTEKRCKRCFKHQAIPTGSTSSTSSGSSSASGCE